MTKEQMNEICGICGFTYGSHCGGDYRNTEYNTFIPKNCCPKTESGMDWREDKTIFKSTGKFKEN